MKVSARLKTHTIDIDIGPWIMKKVCTYECVKLVRFVAYSLNLTAPARIWYHEVAYGASRGSQVN